MMGACVSPLPNVGTMQCRRSVPAVRLLKCTRLQWALCIVRQLAHATDESIRRRRDQWRYSLLPDYILWILDYTEFEPKQPGP